MYESWYLNKSDEYNDQFHEDFDIFGLKCRDSETKLARLDTEDVLGWIGEDTLDRESSASDLRLLLARHKRYEYHEIKPWYMAFEQKHFHQICNTLKLPSDYLFLRKSAAGCGTFTKHTTFDEQGAISHLGFSVRIPHSPRNNAKAIWSLAVSWNASNNHTSALFEAVSDADIQEVQQYLQARQALKSHPLLLPMMLLEMITTYYIDHRRALERSLYVVENQLGVTRGKRKTDVWDWDYNLHRDSTKQCNDIYTGLVYLERRLEFAIGLSQFLLDCFATFEEQGLNEQRNCSNFLSISRVAKEIVVNNHNFAKSQHSQTLCLQKRCQALITMMFTVIAQQDSKINVKIARAAKRDSSSMTAIAVLGFTFLPAMLVASMFSMSMFDFSTTRSGPSFVTSNFWVYWIVTIPLTLAALTAYKLWMSFQKDTSVKKNETLQQERTILAQSMHEANLAFNSPFYPGSRIAGQGQVLDLAKTP